MSAGIRRACRQAGGVALALVATAWVAGARSEAAETNRMLAVVNEEVITEGDLNARLSAFLKQQDDPTLDGAQAAQMRQAVLQRLIEERLIIQEAKQMPIGVSADEVAERLKAVRKQFEPRERYDAMLQDARMTEEQLRTKIREQLLVQRAIDQHVRSTIVVSPSELRGVEASAPPAPETDAAPEEVQAYHLLIRVTPERSAAEAEALAHALYEQLLHGADIKELAVRYSEDPQAHDGGMLGWVPRGQLLPELDEVLFRLQPGELSAPIKTRLGFHLVKVVQRRQGRAPAAAERDGGLEQLYQEKFVKAMREWIDRLKEHAYIQVMDEE